MNQATIRKQLAELAKTLDKPSAPTAGAKAADGLNVSHGEIDKLSIEQSLELLRLCLKYVAFDLEATRRENHYLRKMLVSRQKPPSGGGPSKDEEHRQDGGMQ